MLTLANAPAVTNEPVKEWKPTTFDSGYVDSRGSIPAATIPDVLWPETLPALFVNYKTYSVLLLVREGHEQEDLSSLCAVTMENVSRLESMRRDRRCA